MLGTLPSLKTIYDNDSKKRMLFSVKFRLRNQNHNPQTNLTPLYCRIIVNGVGCPDIFTGVRCNPQKWNVQRQMITGNSKETLQDNQTLENIRTDLKSIINQIGTGVTAIEVRKRYIEKDIPPPTVLEMFQKYITEKKENLKGTKVALKKETIEKWYYSKSHLESFVTTSYKLSDVKKGFGYKYYSYLMKLGTMQNDHAIRNVNYLCSVLDYAVEEKHLDFNPISLDGLRKDPPKDIIYLKPEIVEQIESMSFGTVFQQSIDLFLFICYTSLDNNELRNFEPEKHILGNSIVMIRGKSERFQSKQIIPILPKARRMLEKYNYKLPVHFTHTLNRYLDALEHILNLHENLTTKVGRKTAGMFFLLNGVPIEVVSRILGHKSVITTQRHYADIINSLYVMEKTKHLI